MTRRRAVARPILKRKRRAQPTTRDLLFAILSKLEELDGLSLEVGEVHSKLEDLDQRLSQKGV